MWYNPKKPQHSGIQMGFVAHGERSSGYWVQLGYRDQSLRRSRRDHLRRGHDDFVIPLEDPIGLVALKVETEVNSPPPLLCGFQSAGYIYFQTEKTRRHRHPCSSERCIREVEPLALHPTLVNSTRDALQFNGVI